MTTEFDELENNRQILELIQKNPNYKGTIFEDYFEIMSKGVLAEASPPRNPGEQIIREMNSFEKGFISLVQKYVRLQNDLQNNPQPNEGESASLKETTVNKLARLTLRANSAEDLLIFIIQENLFNGHELRIGFRKGFLLVQMPHVKKEENKQIARVEQFTDLLNAFEDDGAQRFDS